MSRLVKELKEEHTEIIDSLLRVKMLKVCSDDGQRILMQVKDLLLAHLKKEDNELYPALRDASSRDKTLAEELNRFESDMVEVTRTAGRFFDKYSADVPSLLQHCAKPSLGSRIKKLLGRDGESPEQDFAADFDNLFATLLARVRQEENVLYKSFDRLD